MTLDEVTKSSFEECLSHTFVLKIPDGPEISVRLVAVDSLSSTAASPAGGSSEASGSSRESFSVLFIAPKDWRGRQRIYTLAHPQLGALDLFLVPIGPDDRGMRLEGIFNFAL
jgi:hypothetical protein